MIRKAFPAVLLFAALSIVGGSRDRAAAAPPGGAPAPQRAAVRPPAKEGQARTIKILGVGFAAEGGIIMVSFTCDPRDTSTIYQGTVSVNDEATGAIFNGIIVLPKVGPLIGRPTKRGQKGFVMLANPGNRLKPGDTVTVTIAGVCKEHLRVEDWKPRAAASAPPARGKDPGK